MRCSFCVTTARCTIGHANENKLGQNHGEFKSMLEMIVQTRIGGLTSISKHREMLKVRGEVKYFLTNFEVM